MSGLKILAIMLIVAGALALAYGGFTYTKKTHTAQVGPIDVSVDEKETVNIPLWAGVGAVVAGSVLLLTPVLRGRRE
jgi:TRAP-type C4-dicarboxylate transport system permease small subunit